MTRTRNMVSEGIASLLDFGLVVASEVETATRMVLGMIRGDTDPDGNEEPTTAQEMWGCPAVMFRPADESAAGAMEVVFLRRGSEMVGIAYRELRDAPLSLAAGEVCVRAFGTQTSYIHLKPNGEVRVRGDLKVIIESAGTIELGTASLEPLVKGTTFGLFFNAHVHPDPVSGTTGTPVVLMSGAQLSSKVKTQ